MQTYTLTDDQQAAADAFAVFMASQEKALTISGSAGVGKTTLLRHLRDSQEHVKVAQILGVKPITDWEFTATTNKAAEVLGDSLGTTARTIHSLLGIKVHNDFTTGHTKLVRSKNSLVLENKLIVIDEASMADAGLLRLIDQCTHNCKFLYVGDHCQMAPVGETISPVFALTKTIQINQIVRAANTPPILELCKQLRETVETGVFKPMLEVPGVIDYLTPEQAQQTITEHFVLNSNNPEARILCYTNKLVNNMNSWLRQLRGLPDEFVTGEKLVSNSVTSYEHGSNITRIEQQLTVLGIQTGLSYEFQVGKTIQAIPYYSVVVEGGRLRVPYSQQQLDGLLNHFKKEKNWANYFSLKEQFADLRPVDTCTAYKAQGSTYHTAFVHLEDIGRCTNAAQAARMLYVACSRATDRIYFIGKLPQRFQGE